MLLCLKVVCVLVGVRYMGWILVKFKLFFCRFCMIRKCVFEFFCSVMCLFFRLVSVLSVEFCCIRMVELFGLGGFMFM